MTSNRLTNPVLYGAGFFALCLATAGLAWSMDPRQQSTGPGVIQGEDGSMSTKQGGNTGPTAGPNQHSGSATGAVRDPSQAEPRPGTAKRRELDHRIKSMRIEDERAKQRRFEGQQSQADRAAEEERRRLE